MSGRTITRTSRRRRIGTAVTTAAVLATAALTAAGPAAAADCTGSSTYVVAHQDDTLLFASPSILDDVRDGWCVQTIFVTAGDANRGASYWSGRDDGAKAAYARMAGVPDVWNDTTRNAAGRQVHVSTLNGNPRVSLVFLRLPEGATPSGDGGSTYGFQSIKKLWFGTIPSMQTVDGAQSYTRGGLVATLAALIDGAASTRIATHEYTGSISGNDNVDHYVTGYFVREALEGYTRPHLLLGYQGYDSQHMPSNVGGADLAAKSAAFYAYTPHDPLICQTPAACASRPDGAWLSREYVVASEAGPGDGGGLANVAGSASVSASSVDGQQTADKAVDGVVAGYPEAPLNEWSTRKGKAGSWLQLGWTSPQTLTKVVLYDRPNLVDQATGGVLQFDDGSQVAVGPLPNDGSPLEVTFAPRSVTGLRFTVSSVLKGTVNVGLAEIETWAMAGDGPGDPGDPPVVVPVAAAGVDQSVASGAVVTLDGSGSSAGSGGALSYAWAQVSGPSVGLSSASAVGPSFTAPTGPATLVFRLTVSNSAGQSTDQVAVQVQAPPVPPGDDGLVNIAGQASVWASSVDGQQTADKAVDGVVAGYPEAPLNEWSTRKGKAGSWLVLDWGSSQTLSKVVLYDRPNLVDQVTGGLLQFDDGSQVEFGPLPNDGSPLEVTFAPRTVTAMRFYVTGVRSGTVNIGLAEIEAWAPQ